MIRKIFLMTGWTYKMLLLLLVLPLSIFAGSITIRDAVSTPVNDNSCFDRTFNIPLSSAITDVIIEVNLDHTWRADLDISLISPLTTTVDLSSDNGGRRNNLYVIFNDAAAESITDDNSNHTTTVERSPEVVLSTFDAENPQGTWTLRICDDETGDTGIYNYSELTLYNADPSTPPMISTIPDQKGLINTAYTFDVSNYVISTDGDSILSYRLDGILPVGLSFNTSTGVISGTPTVEEISTVTVYATDNDGESAGKSFGIKINPDSPLLEYRMDEYYWIGTSGSVKDSSDTASNGSHYNSAKINTNTASINFSSHYVADGDLVETDDAAVGNTNGTITVSFWVKLDQQMGNWSAVLMKTKPYNWSDGWGFENPDNAPGDNFRFFIGDWNSNNQYVDSTLSVSEGWTHFVGTYDGATIRLYKNGVEVGSKGKNGLPVTSSYPLRLGHDTDSRIATLKGNIDEVKIWEKVLSATEILAVYNNELNGDNYDGSVREPVIAQASIAAHTWEYVGIPADLRTGSYTIADIFSDDMLNAYGTDWRVYRRDYSDTNNSSEYTYLSSTTEVLDFAKGYLLGSSNAETWDVNDLSSVEYNSTNLYCTANRCVEIDVKSASLDADVGDDLLGEGPYRYNLSGFTGKVPVDWADCRFIIDGVAYTPSAAEVEGSVSKTIWQYNPGSGADSNGYTTCDDTVPGGCKLEPYKAFWVELHGSSKGKTVKLLIPQE